MDNEVHTGLRNRSADVLPHTGDEHRRCQRREAHEVAIGRQHIHDFARRGRQLHRALSVDDGRLAGHRDRLFYGPHSQVGVDVRRETGRELDPFTLDGAESCKRERHTVGAGTQIDDRVSPLTVCHDGSSFFDEGRARCLDRHTGQDRARRIAHDAGNRAGLSLGVDPRRNEHQHCEREEAKGSCTSIPHESPPVDCFDDLQCGLCITRSPKQVNEGTPAKRGKSVD